MLKAIPCAKTLCIPNRKELHIEQIMKNRGLNAKKRPLDLPPLVQTLQDVTYYYILTVTVQNPLQL